MGSRIHSSCAWFGSVAFPEHRRMPSSALGTERASGHGLCPPGCRGPLGSQTILIQGGLRWQWRGAQGRNPAQPGWGRRAFLETQKPKRSPTRLSGSWAGKEVERGISGLGNSTGLGLGLSECSHTPLPLLHVSQVCDCSHHPPLCSLLEAEGYRKPGLLLSRPVCTRGLQSMLCP